MNDLLKKTKEVVLSLEKKYGPILIFTLFLRTDPFEAWDVVVSATWLTGDLSSYKRITSELQSTLSREEFLQLARVVILDVNDPVVSFLQDTASVKNGHFEEVSGDIFTEKFGFTIKKAYLLRCQKDEKNSNNF
jgi:hypothetical protein